MTSTMQVTWGERLRIEVDRWRRANDCDFQTLAAACATVEDATSNTYKKLLWEPIAPRGKAARRAYVLILAIGGAPSDFDVELDGRPVIWPDDNELRGLLDTAILTPAPAWVTGDSSAPGSRWVTGDSDNRSPVWEEHPGLERAS